MLKNIFSYSSQSYRFYTPRDTHFIGEVCEKDTFLFK